MSGANRRKAFGQHFLIDQKIIDQIVDKTFALAKNDQAKTLIEIGPGPGAITRPLIEKFKSVGSIENFFIVEMDRRFADHWRETTQDHSEEIVVVSQDFLKVDLEPLLAKTPVHVVSNLPYSSGTAILLKLCEYPERIPAMTLMFQKEVADRLRAEPDTSDWGSLSLWVQNRWDVERLCLVPARAFRPPPKVLSEVVVVTPRKTVRIAGSEQNPALWNQLLRLAFAQRRKMLRSSLPKGSPFIMAMLEAGIPETERAERLTWDQWNTWFSKLVAIKSKS